MSLDFIFKHDDIEPKGAILLFHGLTGSPFELKKYGQFLFKNGYDVYAECLPGHGDNFEEIYTIKYQQWLDFAYSRFKNLKSEYEDVYVSGLCLGAVLALAVGEKFKDEVNGIISLSTTLYLDGWRLPWYKFLIPLAASTILRFYYNYPECEPHGIKNEKTRSIVKKLLAKGDVGMNDFPMTGFYELLKLSAVVRKNLKSIITPILLIHSLEDDLTSVKSANVVYKNISSSDKNLIILKNSYHMVLYDNEKEFVFDESIKFIEAHLNKKIKEELVPC
ncbi:alpha/beta fold hydrolase [bacterium]|nr:alpha/beta fold hydrolase [bacterium]